MGVHMFLYGTGFQGFDFSAFLHDSLSATNTRLTLCGTPLTPFECIRVPVYHADTTTIFLDALFHSLLQPGVTVLFLTDTILLHKCLHRFALFRTTCQIKDGTLVVGTLPSRVFAFQPHCKAASVPLRSTRRIVRLTDATLMQNTLFLGSLAKQYGARALLASLSTQHCQYGALKSFEMTRAAMVYMVETHHLGCFVMLVFSHADLAWDAFQAQHVWWPVQVRLLTEAWFKAHEWTPVVVNCMHAQCTDLVCDGDNTKDIVIEFH